MYEIHLENESKDVVYAKDMSEVSDKLREIEASISEPLKYSLYRILGTLTLEPKNVEKNQKHPSGDGNSDNSSDKRLG